MDDLIIKLQDADLKGFRVIPPNPKELTLIPGATHLFEEPGTLDQAAIAARNWFAKYLATPST